MYFYCWVEICTNHTDCAQHCTIICECVAVCFALYTAVLYGVLLICASPPAASEGERQRREVTSESDPVQLVSFGPLLLGHNDTELEDTPCVKQSTSKPHLAETYSSHVMDQWRHLKCFSLFLSVSGDGVHALWCWCWPAVDPAVHSMVEHQEEAEARSAASLRRTS